MEFIEELEQNQEEQTTEYTLKVFQTSQNNYVIGLVDVNELNALEYAFNIHHVLFIEFESNLNDYIIFEDTLINSSMIYNLNKRNVISMAVPRQEWHDTYYEMIDEMVNRSLGYESDDGDQDNNNNFYAIGTIQ